MTDQPLPITPNHLDNPDPADLLDKLKGRIKATLTDDDFAAMKAKAQAKVDEMVEGAMTMISHLPPEHRLLGLFLHFCGHTDGAEHGMRIGATVGMSLVMLPPHQQIAVQAISVRAVQEYSAAVTQGMTNAYIARFAPEKSIENIMDDLAELEKKLFPEFAEEIDATVAEKRVILKASQALGG